MKEEVKVSVNSWGPGRSLTLSWVDPITGKRKTRSAKTKDWRQAERLAGKLAEELESGDSSPSRVTWGDFVQRYTDEKLATLAPSTLESARVSLNHVKRVLGLEHLAKLTAAAVSKAAAEWRKEGMRDATIAHHLRHVKAAARWAKKIGLLRVAPEIEMPKRAKGSQARSRAITGEEYERIVLAASKARPGDAPQWARFLTGLWLSGLRRSEALALTWDSDGAFSVHLAEKRPVFVIRPEGQKSGKAEVVPMSPEFGAWLLAVPESQRNGPVLAIVDTRTNCPLGANRVGRIVERIGEKAKVKVGTRMKRNRKTGKADEIPVYAGCHSFRRGFGSKWARRVVPSVLKRLMRHSSVATTEAYYVNMEAADVVNELWFRYGGDPGPVPAGSQQNCNTPPVTGIPQ